MSKQTPIKVGDTVAFTARQGGGSHDRHCMG